MTRNTYEHGSRRIGAGGWVGAIACAAAVALWAPWPAAAHHSFAAEFDASRQVKITGEVSKVEWQNPHAWIHVNVHEVCERPGRERPQGGDNANADSKPEPEWTCNATAGGGTVEWGFELASPNGLMRQGWTRKSLNEGDHVTVEGWRARDGGPNGSARVVTANGKRLFAGSSQSPTQ
jgi:hypothetical protein